MQSNVGIVIDKGVVNQVSFLSKAISKGGSTF